MGNKEMYHQKEDLFVIWIDSFIFVSPWGTSAGRFLVSSHQDASRRRIGEIIGLLGNGVKYPSDE